MMYSFICSVCQQEITADESYQGQLVECPICNEIQIVPEKAYVAGDVYDVFKIDQLVDTTIVWNTYEAVGTINSDFHNQKVLLKIPSLFLKQNLQDFDSFINMVCRNSSLNTTEFLQLIERGGDAGNPYFIYKFEDTMNLADFASFQAPMDPYDALRIIRLIAHAMNTAWNKDRIIHQNLIPQNIRITAKHGIRIDEVGVSEFMLNHPELLENGLDIWNVRYMSPEFVTDGVADSAAVDIYSLGCLLYLLLTGQDPYASVSNPALIPQLEAPNPLKVNQSISHMIYNLYNSMVEKNVQLRIKSWIKLLEEIDNILDKSTQRIPLGQYQKNYELAKNKMKRTYPRGFNLQGTGTWMKVSREDFAPEKKVIKKPKNKKKTHVRLLKKGELDVKNVRKKLQKQAPQEEVSTLESLAEFVHKNIAFILVFLVGAGAVMGFLIYALSQREDSPKKAIVKSDEPAKAQAPQTTKTTEHQNPQTVQNQASDTTKPLTLKDKMEKVAEFYSNNPKQFGEAIKQYEALIEDALKEKQFRIMDELNERILTIQKVQDKLVYDTLKEIKTHAEALWKEGKHQEALAYLNDYSGKHQDETKMQRKIYYRKLESLIKQQEQQVITAEKKKEQNEKQKNDILNKAFADAPKLIYDGKVDAVIQTLSLVVDTNTIDDLKPFLSNALSDLKLYQQLPDLIDQKYKKQKGTKCKIKFRDSVRSIFIDNVSDGQVFYRESTQKQYFTFLDLSYEEIVDIIKNNNTAQFNQSYLLSGLIFAEQYDYEAAKESFSHMPERVNLIFCNSLSFLKEEQAFKAILAEFKLRYDSYHPTTLKEELNERKISGNDAKRLFDQIQSFSEHYKNSAFLQQNSHILKALTIFCNKFMDTKKRLTSSITLDTPNEGSNKKLTSQELTRALLNALGKFGRKKIELKPGVYQIPNELLDFSEVTLIGQPGVIFRGKMSIYGDNISLSGIHFDSGEFIASSNTRKLNIENCIFTGDMPRINGGSRITIENCVFRGLSVNNSKSVRINQCTFISPRQGAEKQAALWLDVAEIEVLNSVIYGEHYGVIFTDKGKRKDKDFQYCLWYGKKGFAALRGPKGVIEQSSVVDRDLKLRKYCKPRNNIYEEPQFVDPNEGDWNLVKGSPGYEGTEKKKSCGAIIVKESK